MYDATNISDAEKERCGLSAETIDDVAGTDGTEHIRFVAAVQLKELGKLCIGRLASEENLAGRKLLGFLQETVDFCEANNIVSSLIFDVGKVLQPFLKFASFAEDLWSVGGKGDAAVILFLRSMFCEQDTWDAWVRLLTAKKWPIIASFVLDKASVFSDEEIQKVFNMGKEKKDKIWFALRLISCGVLQTIVAPLLRCPGIYDSLCKLVHLVPTPGPKEAENNEEVIVSIIDDLTSNEDFQSGLFDIIFSDEFDSCYAALVETFSDDEGVTGAIRIAALCYAAFKILRLLLTCKGVDDAWHVVWRKLKLDRGELRGAPSAESLRDLLADLLEHDDLISGLLGIVGSLEVDGMFDAFVKLMEADAAIKGEAEVAKLKAADSFKIICNSGPLRNLFVSVFKMKDLRTAISGGLRLDQFKAGKFFVAIQEKLDVINLLLQNRGIVAALSAVLRDQPSRGVLVELLSAQGFDDAKGAGPAALRTMLSSTGSTLSAFMLDFVDGASGVAEALGFAADQATSGGPPTRTETDEAAKTALRRAAITLKRVTQEHEEDVLAAEVAVQRAVDALNRTKSEKREAVTVAKRNVRQCESKKGGGAESPYNDSDSDRSSDSGGDVDWGMPVPEKNLAAKSAAAREPVGENGYNGRYLGQVPIPNNRPDQDTLWSAIDALKIESAKVGRIDVTVMIVPGKGVRGGKRRPKMLQMATQSGRFSLSQPFHQIQSVGQVGNHVVIVCWTRGQDTKRTKSFLVHAVKFKQADDAEAMSKVLIKECEEVYKRKGVMEESVHTGSPDKGESVDVVKQDDDALGYAVAEEMMTDKDALLEVVKKNGSALSHASDTLKADEDVVLEAVRQNGLALEYAAARLKAHEGVVLTAVKENGLALEYAAARFKARKDVALIAVKQDGSALKYAGTHMKADKDVVLEAVKQDGRALKHVHKKWKADKDVVMEAVKQNGSALCRAADAMRVDKDIVMEAVKQDGRALYHAAEDLKSDKDVVMEAVKQNGLALEYAANVLRADEAVVLEAVKQNDSAVEYAADELKSTDQVMHTIEDNESATAFTTLELIEERSALFALRNSGRNILSTANSSENNSDIIKPALVDLLRQLNADSSKQQKALHRLERLMQLHHSLCATDDRVATTLTSASNGCAVAIVSTETTQQQAAKIQECLDGFDTAQRVLRKAARTPDVHDESGDDPSTAKSLVSELAATVIKRNESRSHFCQNLGTFQSRWNDHLIIRLGYLKEKLDDLHKTRDLFAAGRNSGASDEGTFVRPLPDSIKDAVFAFDAWWARVKEVCESTTTSTDQAFADLGQHFSSALTHTVRGVTATDALEGQLAAVQEKLRTVAANVRIEKEYWASDPLRSLPYDRILTACGQIIQSFEAEAAETEDMLQQVEEWDARAKDLREVPVYPTDLEVFFSLDDAVWELNKKLRRAHFDVEDFKEDARRRKSSRTQSKLDDATKLAAKYHEELREAGAKFQVEKKRLKI